jgi:oxygen-independent coproporphyrinogen-3 oxidase
MERLDTAGYLQYEISNWAKDQRFCLHNMQYWRNLPYLGFGAGAHGYAGGIRTANVLAPKAYIQRCTEGSPRSFPLTPATQTSQVVSREAELAETMMMGLRLVQEGVQNERFQERFGCSLDEAYHAPIQKLVQQGLLEWACTCLRLTKAGRLLGNRVFVEFI